MHVLVRENSIVKVKTFVGEPPVLSVNKGEWIAFVAGVKPDFDKSTQKLSEGGRKENGEWTQTWTVVGLEGQELVFAQNRAAARARREGQAQAYIDNMPDWSQVAAAVDNIASLGDAKAFLLKLARVVYWNVKGTET